jgi:hypothetical protein
MLIWPHCFGYTQIVDHLLSSHVTIVSRETE